ncbi:hypothetical protein WA026_007194 [Henosepilachna vigintioctopunctata]|uniref:Uncharacterized protein n=1 Tax=Henosepilachna vigintioctopunctata TaxID=420089 RepID=A0AAW1V294_9CUCU
MNFATTQREESIKSELKDFDTQTTQYNEVNETTNQQWNRHWNWSNFISDKRVGSYEMIYNYIQGDIAVCWTGRCIPEEVYQLARRTSETIVFDSSLSSMREETGRLFRYISMKQPTQSSLAIINESFNGVPQVYTAKQFREFETLTMSNL